MLSNCGHSPHRDQREAALAKMAEFVKRVVREGAGAPEESQRQTTDLQG
jgi:hypothetical protein